MNTEFIFDGDFFKFCSNRIIRPKNNIYWEWKNHDLDLNIKDGEYYYIEIIDNKVYYSFPNLKIKIFCIYYTVERIEKEIENGVWREFYE